MCSRDTNPRRQIEGYASHGGLSRGCHASIQTYVRACLEMRREQAAARLRQLVAALQAYHLERVYVFDSWARGEEES